jgi:hypothetical protein
MESVAILLNGKSDGSCPIIDMGIVVYNDDRNVDTIDMSDISKVFKLNDIITFWLTITGKSTC